MVQNVCGSLRAKLTFLHVSALLIDHCSPGGISVISDQFSATAGGHDTALMSARVCDVVHLARVPPL